MGMVALVTQLNDETMERLIADPPLVWRVIAPDDLPMYERARAEAGPRKPGFVARLFGAQSPPPAAVAPFALGDGEGKETYLDKAWHGIHFLLTGKAEEGDPPLDFLLSGGREIGDEDVGMGPARVFSASETRTIAAALAALGDDDLRGRFDPQAMEAADVYPDVIWVRDGEEALSYVMTYFGALRESVMEAAGTNRGLMVTLS